MPGVAGVDARLLLEVEGVMELRDARAVEEKNRLEIQKVLHGAVQLQFIFVCFGLKFHCVFCTEIVIMFFYPEGIFQTLMGLDPYFRSQRTLTLGLTRVV